MKYKIGEVSHILGISPDLLRYYEKKGIVHPRKGATNDYRYYEAWDINFLMDCIWYKGFHFSLEQVSHIISDSTADEIADQLDMKIRELKEQSRRNELLVRRAGEQRADLMRLENQLGKCVLRNSPEFVRYLNRRGDVYDSGEELQNVSQEWLEYMPFTHRCFEIPVSAVQQDQGAGRVRWGFSLTPDYIRELGVKTGPPVEHVKSRKCIYTVFTSQGKGQFSPRKLQYVFQYASEHNLKPEGMICGNLLASLQYKGKLTGFFEAWVPYRK
ncbi:MAG: MerR family transcriptional regulator [Oscillospiraceae bacterium]|nr:MerR family transcriptional regulator [Oscillospiraceae bacterium]